MGVDVFKEDPVFVFVFLLVFVFDLVLIFAHLTSLQMGIDMLKV